MSRTDVHRPGWVQERDPTMRRFFRISHTHTVREEWDPESRRWLVQREVPCNLGAADRWSKRCGPQYHGGRNIYCGCPNCTGRDWRRQERRRDRHQARRAIGRERLVDG